MHLIYMDEPGNTGVDLNDSAQPVFVLGGWLVPEDRWLQLETDLNALGDQFFPAPRPDNFELHATELINSRGYIRQFAIDHRLKFFQQALLIAAGHQLHFVYRAIIKKRFAKRLRRFGGNVGAAWRSAPSTSWVGHPVKPWGRFFTAQARTKPSEFPNPQYPT